MKEIEQIKELITEMPVGTLFSAKSFRHLASSDNIKQILSRLVKQGVIERSARGIYLKPKVIEGIGKTLPSAREIAKTLTESTGETILVHGAEAARQLHLTTQVPMRLIFYTNGNSRKLKIGNHTIELKHANPSRMIAAGTKAGIAISALLYLTKKNVTNKIIDTVKSQLSPDEFNQVLKEIENMPVWLADAFYQYNNENKHD